MQSAGLGEDHLLRPEKMVFSKALDTYTLGFVIAPRLNAAGRLEHAGIAVDLLLETDPQKAAEKAQNLESINARRQNLTASVLSEAKEKVLLLKERKILALVGEGWPKGIMGLVAGKLAEEFYKPTIVLERTENLCTGSARTAGEFDMLEALKFSSEHLSKFGGHKQAAGLTLQADKFELFYQKLLVYAEENINKEKSQKVLELEAQLSPENLQLTTYNLIADGAISEVEETQKQGKEILRSAALPQNDAGGRRDGREISGIMFNAPDFAKTLKIGDTVDAAAELIEDNWNGRQGIKLRILDFKLNP
jgi:single-stranded-DNA-specific exonuclease